MSEQQVVSVILSGGSGTRLWPKSRKSYPKQLLSLVGKSSMLQQTAARVAGFQKTIVVCNEEHRFLVADQLSEVCHNKPDIILEPAGRNTAPAIAIASLQAMKKAGDPVMVVLPSDHLIKDLKGFNASLNIACRAAAEGDLVTFGVRPMGPETGYGYIHAPKASHDQACRISNFVEKPDLDTAQHYLATGEYFWNSGMFVFKASVYLDALKKYAPAIYEACLAVFSKAIQDSDFIRLDAALFSGCPSDSIDYAVMEKAENSRMVPLLSDWSDLGSWSALWDVSDKDKQGNVVRGDVVSVDCEHCLFDSHERLIAAVGLSDIVVVETKDALMVAHRDKAQQVKEIVETLAANERNEHILLREVHRPWGTYDSIDNGPTHQVKHIMVKPGASISLQLHHRRSEHWVVISGQALVQLNEEKIILYANESIGIPAEARHRLTNPGTVPLHIIEVQCGDYLGEDDIVRFDDIYGREKKEQLEQNAQVPGSVAKAVLFNGS